MTHQLGGNGLASVEPTCASRRQTELREGLIRAISKALALEVQAQASLFEGDDEMALACLRCHWKVTRAQISPIASELADLGRRP